MRPVLVFLLIVVSAACKDEPPSNQVRVSGHVEATEVRLAPEVGGRIVALNVKEGDRVDAGTVILRLDTRDAELAIDRARAEQHAAEAQLRLLQAGSRREDVGQAEAQTQAARDEVQAARAELTAAEADLERFESLLEANAGSRKQRDDARTRRDVAREHVQAAESRMRASEQAVQRLRAGARVQEIDAARARVAAAAAQVATIEESLKDTTLRSPIRGVLSEKLAELGEVVGPNVPVVVIASAWARAPRFLPTPAAAGLAARSRSFHPRRNSRRGTSRPRKNDRSWSTAFASASTTRRAFSRKACRSRLKFRWRPFPEMDAALSFDRVTRRYGQIAAVAEVSLEVRRGEMFGLIGPDGAGKTTTIRLFCGLLRPDSGAVRVLGRDPVKEHRAITAQVGYLSQRFSLYGDLSIDENIAFFAEIHGLRDYRARRDRLLEMTQLVRFRDRLADQLSGGMKQKLALACTLVHEPDIILLDEPTTGVDPVSRREFWKLLSQFLAAGITIVMATPYLDEAERCTRVAMLDRGRLLALDEPDRLRASLAGTLLEVVVAEPRTALDLLKTRAHVDNAQVFGDRLHVWSPAADTGAALEEFDRFASRAGVNPSSVRRITPSLEDVFISKLSV
jgi:drug efflux transport system ATP-binding protein